MCRIAGAAHISTGSQEVPKMVQAMHRGGPDDEGVYVDPSLQVVLGHRRLSIIDLSAAGHQPFVVGDGDYALTYNGELYNYATLREELEHAGVTFTTKTDTEVLLQAFRVWGEACIHKFNGMYAFAILDKKKQQLFLARDHAGIKPLYFSLHNGGFYFASELRAFKALGYWTDNEDWRIHFLAFGHLPEPVTTLRGVQPLPKGSCLVYDLRKHTCSVFPSGKQTVSSAISSRNEAKILIRETLRSAVERHLISDAPIGLFLSGGLDSSILTVLAQSVVPDSLQTLSIYFDSARYSEAYFQELIITQTGARHHRFKVSLDDFKAQLPDIHSAMDMPSIDGINSYFISAYARQIGLKAVLSGVGADELLGGYASFSRARWLPLLKKTPLFLRDVAARFSNKALNRLSSLSLGGATGEYLFYRGIFSVEEIARILGVSPNHVRQVLQSLPSPGTVFERRTGAERAGWLEYNYYMQNQLLRDVDYMSMWHGLEVRVPFLDKEFISACDRITPSVKFSGTYPKQLLIDAFLDQLPVPIWKRRKRGFTFPFDEWFRSDTSLLQQAGMPSWTQKAFMEGKWHWSKIWAVQLLNQH